MSFCGFQTRLNEAKDRSGMCDEQIGYAVNRNRKAICQYRNGESMPNAEVLYNMCIALDVSADWLLGLER